MAVRQPKWAIYNQTPAEYNGLQGIIYHNGMRYGAWTCCAFHPSNGDKRTLLFRHTNFSKVSAKFEEFKKQYGR